MIKRKRRKSKETKRYFIGILKESDKCDNDDLKRKNEICMHYKNICLRVKKKTESTVFYRRVSN